MQRTFLAATILLLAIGSASAADQRFLSGPYYGFTKLTPEHVINEIGKPLHVTEVSGVITTAKSREPIHKALFELREDTTGKVKATHADAEGKFHLRNIPDGKYTFKTTCKGYQSVVGVIVVHNKAEKPDEVAIEMPLQFSSGQTR